MLLYEFIVHPNVVVLLLLRKEHVRMWEDTEEENKEQSPTTTFTEEVLFLTKHQHTNLWILIWVQNQSLTFLEEKFVKGF